MEKNSSQDLHLQITSLVMKQFDISKEIIKDDLAFLDLGDEFDHIELIMKIEELFEISINDEDAKSLLNINSVMSFLQKV